MRRLLLVDDELEIAQLAAEYFSSLGWDARAASSVSEAERLIDKSGPFDAAVIDWVIGGSTARGLIERLETRQPRCRVLLTSGHGVDILRDNSEGVPVLRKPFTLRALARRVEALLPAPQER